MITKNRLSLIDRDWNWFYIKNIFNSTQTKKYREKDIKLYRKGKYPFVSSSCLNNGSIGFYDFYTNRGGNVLTIGCKVDRGNFCFYQPVNFSLCHGTLVLTPLFTMNNYVAMFLVTLINIEKFRYDFGRQITIDRIANTRIKLPINSHGDIDSEFMEEYIKSLMMYNGIKFKF